MNIKVALSVCLLGVSSTSLAWEAHIDPLFPAAPIIFGSDDGPNSPFPNQVLVPGANQGTCFVAGTLIDLNGYGQAAIENISIGDLVKSAGQGDIFTKTMISPSIAVVDRLSKFNATHPITVLRLVNGITLKGTSNHPIATSDGFVQMGKLSSGMKVHTKSGLVDVESVTNENFSGFVYNFSATKSASGYKISQGTYFANGILVGDLAMQEKQ